MLIRDGYREKQHRPHIPHNIVLGIGYRTSDPPAQQRPLCCGLNLLGCWAARFVKRGTIFAVVHQGQ